MALCLRRLKKTVHTPCKVWQKWEILGDLRLLQSIAMAVVF